MIKGVRFFLALWLAAVSPVFAQTTPSADQLELLRSLSPEDRAALLEQLGLGGAVLDDGGSMRGESTERDERRRDPGDFPRSRNGELLMKPEDKLLKAEDSVIVELALKRDKPPRIEQATPDADPITIPGEPAPTLPADELAKLSDLIAIVGSRNPYLLDRNGQLLMPGFDPIELAGLNEEQATHRLRIIADFKNLDVKLTRLPIKKTGFRGLEPFGYDLFRDSTSTFAPVTDVPVPSDYVIGPGDQLVVQLFGTQNRSMRLMVGRDGRINFPELGPINVGGRSFDHVAADIEERVRRQLIGVHASVSMGDTRSIRVFVVGEADRPGTYTVSGLATVTSALYAAGGVKPIGSLRDVQLKRKGAVIRRLDLYDLLLRGDTSDDAKLLPGDVVFIPPVGPTVAVDGEVQRPAIYELKGNVSVAEMAQLAGGLTSEADPTRVALVRVDESRARVVVNVPLGEAQGRNQLLRRGDAMRVLRLRPTLDEGVTVEGHVFRPGNVAWQKGLRLSQVLQSIDELKPGADEHYILVRREMPPDRHVVALSGDLAAALRTPGSVADLELMPRDRVIVFEVEPGRGEALKPILDEIKLQSRMDRPSALVRIDGRIKAAGEYPLEPGMRVSDLLRAGGGLTDAAYGASAELARHSFRGDARSTELIEIDLAAVLGGDASANVLLQPFDFLNVREVPEWSEQEKVTLAGEVRFPGVYPIRRGETLHSVLDRAGGLTSLAYAEGSVFTRTELMEREQQQLDRLLERLQSDLAVTSLQAAAANQGGAAQAASVGQSLVSQLKATKAVGRLVIDLQGVITAPVGAPADVVLRDGDRLMIPKTKQEVTVIGEVQTSTSHFYRVNLERDDYIGLSGGMTRKADGSRVYVVRADGSVISSENVGWFRRSAQAVIKPGDTIVVPLDTERLPALPMWQAVTSIIYNLAIAAAAVNSF